MNQPLWIDERDALTLHDRLLVLHGGASGVRDESVLKSALARPQQHFAYAPATDVIQLAAIYTASIVQNHPFVDGNKRTGFVVGILFLELNGYRFMATEEEAASAVLALAGGRIEESGYAEFLRTQVKTSEGGD
jgi:death-on-curing protein